MHNPVATYRIQFHKEFTFKDFEQIIPYLYRLGIKTVYASPIFEATPGSMHGYDVVNPLQINPEIGTWDELKAISKKLHRLNMSWMQDIVPNHMAFHPNNEWLMDVLEKGDKSIYAAYFDILWESPVYDGRIMVPFLGAPVNEIIQNKQLKIIYRDKQLLFNYSGQEYPLHISSWLTLLKSNGTAKNVKAIENQINALAQLTDAKAYAEHVNNIKHRFEHDFSSAFTSAFLKKINSNVALLTQIANEQVYQLCYWQETDKQINFRRFFTVNGLICLNIQHQEVFDHYHQLIKSLLQANVFQGLRVDHVDGLYDPEQYLIRLRKLVGRNTYIIVEKILETNESFPENWPVQGNTGYDFLSAVNNLFTNEGGEKVFSKLYKTLTNKSTDIKERTLSKKELILYKQMAGELENLYQLFIRLQLIDDKDSKSVSPELLKASIAAMLIYFPVYRFYGNKTPLDSLESTALLHVFDEIVIAKPQLAPAISLLSDVLLNNRHNTSYKRRALQFYQRFMQFSGPLMAKGVEDTLMYTYDRFIGHNEVGDSPEFFGLSVSVFNKLMMDRQQHWPLSMNSTATHDTKRGEDVRASLNVLTDIAQDWADTILQWQKINAGLKTNNAPDANDEYFIYQTIIGAYPMPGQDNDDFSNRLQDYLIKVVREAKINSNWAKPNEQYENAVKRFITRLLKDKNAFWKSFTTLHKRVADYGMINSLAQLLLKYTCPGMPDLYQGCELWDFSFVDPDNRRPVDYLKREQFIADVEGDQEPAPELWQRLWENRYNAQIKSALVHLLLQERDKNVPTFTQGAYIPLKVKGKYRDNILAFARHFEQSWYVVVVPLQLAAICNENEDPIQFNWDDTHILLPDDAPLTWQNLLLNSEGHATKEIFIKDLFTIIPLAVLKLSYPPNGRSAGILMHITSLPSEFGIGDIGPEAVRFANFLYHSRQKYWQMLPVNPIDKQAGYSPYSSTSSVAGNTLLISPELLAKDGLVKKADLRKYKLPVKQAVNFDEVKQAKEALFAIAYQNFLKINDKEAQQRFADFKKEQAGWLDDFSLYETLKIKYANAPWYEWPAPYKKRNAAALEKVEQQEAETIDRIKWLQFVFAKQWAQLKSYCNSKSISLFGDMPFYISYDSVDVWARPQIFNLDSKGNVAGIAGVPPDYFSVDGQLWGMPVYNWNELKKQNYTWWINRVKKNLEYFDLIRLDHFRAFADYWEVPAGEETAINGSWKQGPGADFFKQLKNELGGLPFVAEDLGEINEAVYKLRDDFGLPGMKVLQFAFDTAMPFSPHIPHNYTKNNFAYTGTHDNNTIQSWYKHDIKDADRKRIKKYVGKKLSSKTAYKAFIKLNYASVAKVAILPIQDVLGLGESTRMNVPASPQGNWAWRLDPALTTRKKAKWLQKQVIFYNR